MSPDELARFKARLVSLRDALEDAGPLKVDPNRTDATGRRDDDHQPLNEMLQAIASSRNRNRTTELRQIKLALERIARDPEDYGLCIDCDEPIPPRRLELMPAAELCVKCQGEREGAKTGGRRRHLSDYQ